MLDGTILPRIVIAEGITSAARDAIVAKNAIAEGITFAARDAIVAKNAIAEGITFAARDAIVAKNAIAEGITFAARDAIVARNAIAEGMGPVLSGIRSFQSQVSQLGSMIETLDRVQFARPEITERENEDTAYSPEMTSAADYFESTEGVIDSFNDLHSAIQRLVNNNPGLEILWRGQQDASWGMHSSLYRRLMEYNKVHSPALPHRAVEPYPTEDDLVLAEAEILNLARASWRLDDSNALKIMARLQHFGAPTRLLDVSKNPYIAAWFAVESSLDTDGNDARLFALSTLPVVSAERARLAGTLTHLRGDEARAYDPFWHSLTTSEHRARLEWGTGTIRRYWVPPVYEQRILAQNGAFILDGVPVASSSTAPYFKRPGKGSSYWKKADLLASGSIYSKLYKAGNKVRENKTRNFPPTFTYRITSKAKLDIRRALEGSFAYGAPTIYPDIEGLARFIKGNFDELLYERLHVDDVSGP